MIRDLFNLAYQKKAENPVVIEQIPKIIRHLMHVGCSDARTSVNRLSNALRSSQVVDSNDIFVN